MGLYRCSLVFLRSALFNASAICWTVVFTTLFIPVLLFPAPVVVFTIRGWVHVTTWLLAVIVGLKLEVRGRENIPDGPAIFASKHQSAWETFSFHCLGIGARYVVKRELFAIPLYGWFIRGAGSIGVDRGGGGAALKKMVRDSGAALAGGWSVLIFPEGTRAAPGERIAYQPGVASLYARLDAPLVPVALNSGCFWGRRSFVKRPGRIVVEFLPAIPPGLKRREFLAELESRVEAASDRLAMEAKAG